MHDTLIQDMLFIINQRIVLPPLPNSCRGLKPRQELGNGDSTSYFPPTERMLKSWSTPMS